MRKHLKTLNEKKPEEYRKYFRSQNTTCYNSNTSLNDFKNHFQEMFSDEYLTHNANAEEFNSNHDFENFENVLGDLDNQIT